MIYSKNLGHEVQKRAAFLLYFAFLGTCFCLATPTDNGLYAVFQCSRNGNSIGSFTCQLEFEKAPQTVASFVGLAEGSQAWIDFSGSGAVKKPFFDGITFHRVVSDFVVQAGSPNGEGTDGPGYSFKDEFDPTLRHDSPGVLSMANSGLHSNGSQFFVTLNATPHLDDIHSVFGRVIEGLDVVQSIEVGDVINSVRILRIGQAAESFDPGLQGLPSVSDDTPQLNITEGRAILNYGGQVDSEFFVFQSSDLESWTRLNERELFTNSSPPVQRDVGGIQESAMEFFRVSKVTFPSPLHTPTSVGGFRLLLKTPDFDLALNLETETGTFTLSQPALGGSIPTYTWIQEPYRGRLSAGMNGITLGNAPISRANFDFAFSSPSGGNYKGNLVNTIGQNLPLEGVFEFSPLE